MILCRVPHPRAHGELFAVRQNQGHTANSLQCAKTCGTRQRCVPPAVGLRSRAHHRVHAARAPSPARRRAEACRACRASLPCAGSGAHGNGAIAMG